MGTVPMPLAKISPSPRNASAAAITQTSASDDSATAAHRLLVVGLGTGQPLLGPLGPPLGITGRRHVLALEGLVPAVVRLARREVGAAGGLDHAVHGRALDPEGVGGALGQQVLGGHHPLAREEPAAGGGGGEEEVVEVEVGAEELPAPPL